MKIVTCRNCKAQKTAGDICPVCTAGHRQQTLRVRKNQPIGLANAHFFHAPAAVNSKIARGDSR
jgi:methionyl-tRNA synthetase